jgi:hypothetical protein
MSSRELLGLTIALSFSGDTEGNLNSCGKDPEAALAPLGEVAGPGVPGAVLVPDCLLDFRSGMA